MSDQNKQNGGGIEIDRDEYGRSQVQLDQMAGGAMSGGEQFGGGPGQSDAEAPGGSGGTGGYGDDANTVNNEEGRSQAGYGNSQDAGQSRGEAYDEAQGGGRDDRSVSRDDS